VTLSVLLLYPMKLMCLYTRNNFRFGYKFVDICLCVDTRQGIKTETERQIHIFHNEFSCSVSCSRKGESIFLRFDVDPFFITVYTRTQAFEFRGIGYQLS